MERENKVTLVPAAEIDYYNKNLVNEIIVQYLVLTNPEQEVTITWDEINKARSLITPKTRIRTESVWDVIRLSVKEATEEEQKYPDVMFAEKPDLTLEDFDIEKVLEDLVPHG